MYTNISKVCFLHYIEYRKWAKTKRANIYVHNKEEVLKTIQGLFREGYTRKGLTSNSSFNPWGAMVLSV